MSTRGELEEAQAQLKALEAARLEEAQLLVLAQQLEREAELWEQQLDRRELRQVRDDASGPGARLLGFGFAMLAVTPVVAMVGSSLARLLRHETELALLLIGLGLIIITVTSWPRARRALFRRFSGPWREARTARLYASLLKAWPRV